MQINNFEDYVERYKNSSVDEKIDMYITAENLTQEQYKRLLRHFPLNELHKLESALA